MIESHPFFLKYNLRYYATHFKVFKIFHLAKRSNVYSQVTRLYVRVSYLRTRVTYYVVHARIRKICYMTRIARTSCTNELNYNSQVISYAQEPHLRPWVSYVYVQQSYKYIICMHYVCTFITHECKLVYLCLQISNLCLQMFTRNSICMRSNFTVAHKLATCHFCVYH